MASSHINCPFKYIWMDLARCFQESWPGAFTLLIVGPRQINIKRIQDKFPIKKLVIDDWPIRGGFSYRVNDMAIRACSCTQLSNHHLNVAGCNSLPSRHKRFWRYVRTDSIHAQPRSAGWHSIFKGNWDWSSWQVQKNIPNFCSKIGKS